MTIKVFTLGCKVNQCESAAIVATLKAHDYNASEGLDPADVYIINTCSVTAEADKKSRQCIARMKKLNPDCKMIVLGCSSQNDPEKFCRDGVAAVGGTADKTAFVLYVLNVLNDRASGEPNSDDGIIYYNNIKDLNTDNVIEAYPESNKTRAFVKIQDGCNRFCSYCIIPYLRGRSRSRTIDDIVAECRTIASEEIVLTGIDVSAYGKDIGCDFKSLISALSDIPKRKRLSSLECEAVDEGLLAAMKSGGFCPHFHLSLQSGCDEVLKAMNRHYDSNLYYKKVCLIRKFFPNAGITTDVIVGFPTETDENFSVCCKFIERCAFSDIHIFPYSSRTGTVAARKYKALPPETVKQRTRELFRIKAKLHKRFLLDNLGGTEEVYVEDKEGDRNVGYTPNYIKVYSDAPTGRIVNLKLVEVYNDGVLGVKP